MSENLDGLFNRAEALKKCAIREGTLPSHRSSWKGFCDWDKSHDDFNPEVETETVPNCIAACLTHNF